MVTFLVSWDDSLSGREVFGWVEAKPRSKSGRRHAVTKTEITGETKIDP